jgi:hypothetical protein
MEGDASLRAIAVKLSFDPEAIRLSDDDRQVELNERQFHCAAAVDEDGIVIYRRSVTPEMITGIAAHAIVHCRLAGSTPAINGPRDGVSEYSRRSWGAFRSHRIGLDIAIATTLAEMARIKIETSKLPGRREWRELYRRIDIGAKAWDENKHPREPAGSPGGGQFTSDSDGEREAGRGEGSREGRRGGARSAEEAQRAAEKAAAGHAKLLNLPDKPLKVGDAWYVPGPLGKARDVATDYMRSAGLPYDPPREFLKVDKERAARIADAYDKMKHDPDNPAVKASYDALAKETIAQWQAIKATGLKIEWIKEGQEDPYASTPRLAAMDVVDNNHWWGFPTDIGYGSGDEETEVAKATNPMLVWTDEVIDGRRMRVNDLFRVVHDYFGHFKEGVGFRADGEENAWRSHAAIFSDLAVGALTSETRGQNSWVNYGPHGEANRTASAADTIYAPQKIGLMPDWTWKEGRSAASDRD